MHTGLYMCMNVSTYVCECINVPQHCTWLKPFIKVETKQERLSTQASCYLLASNDLGLTFALQLYVEGSLDLEVGYYNEKLAVWEPLIEPVVHGGKMRRWQLNLEVSVRSGSLSDMPLELRKLNRNTSKELWH